MVEKTKEIEVTNVPKDFEKKIKLPGGEEVDQLEFLAWLGNKLLKIEKAVE